MLTAVDNAKSNHDLKKRDLTAAACILLLAMTMLVIEGHIAFPGPSESPVHSELLGTYRVTSRVPVFVLYDPPGDGSYSWCDLAFHNVTMQFRGYTPEFNVIGQLSSQFWFGFSTSLHTAIPGNTIFYLFMNQTWEVDHYSYLGLEWTQANLRNCTLTGGEGGTRFEDCSHYGLWVNDMTNTTSDYSVDFNVSAGTTESASMDCLLEKPEPINAGYNITLMGVEVRMSVLISCPESPIKIDYTFNDTTRPLSFHLFSTTPIQQDPYSTEGALLWFG